MLYYNALDFYAHVICPLHFVPVLCTGVLAKLLSGQAAKFVAASVWLTGQYRRTGIRTLEGESLQDAETRVVKLVAGGQVVGRIRDSTITFVVEKSDTQWQREGGARWCGHAGRPPAGAALWAVNNLMVNIFIMSLSLKLPYKGIIGLLLRLDLDVGFWESPVLM